LFVGDSGRKSSFGFLELTAEIGRVIELRYQSALHHRGSDESRSAALDHVSKATVVLVMLAENKAPLRLW
jgi:hypothetical protein